MIGACVPFRRCSCDFVVGIFRSNAFVVFVIVRAAVIAPPTHAKSENESLADAVFSPLDSRGEAPDGRKKGHSVW